MLGDEGCELAVETATLRPSRDETRAAPTAAPDAVPATVKSTKDAAHAGWRNVVAVPAPDDASPSATPSSEPTRRPFTH